MKKKSARQTDAARLLASQRQRSAFLHLRLENVSSYLKGNESDSDIHVALISAARKQSGQEFRVLVAPATVKVATTSAIPEVHYSGRICPDCKGWPKGRRRKGTFRTAPKRSPKRSPTPSAWTLPWTPAWTDPSAWTPPPGANWRPLPKVEPTWLKLDAPLRLESEKVARQRRTRLYCPAHGLQWVIATNGKDIALECGCHRQLGLPVPAGRFSAEHIPASKDAQDIFPAISGLQPEQVVDHEVARLRKECSIATGQDETPIETHRAELEMTNHEEKDRVTVFNRPKRTNRLIENHDEVDADSDGTWLDSKGMLRFPVEDHKEPRQYTLEDVNSLVQNIGVNLNLDQKHLLRWKAHREPGDRSAHALSNREIAERMGKTPGWVRYSFDDSKRYFNREDRQPEPDKNQQLAAGRARPLTASRAENLSQNVQPARLSEGIMENQLWMQSLTDAALASGIPLDEFCEFITRLREELFFSMLDAAMGVPYNKPTIAGLILGDEERMMVAELVQEAQARGEIPAPPQLPPTVAMTT